MTYVIFIILTITAFVFFFVLLNQTCVEKMTNKIKLLGDLSTKYQKCEQDINNLSTGILNPPPLNPGATDRFAFGSMYKSVQEIEECKLKSKMADDYILEVKKLMKSCDDTRKEKIQELRNVIEKNGKMSNKEFDKLLKEKFFISKIKKKN